MKRLIGLIRAWLFRPIEPEQQADPVDPYLLAILAGGTIDVDAFEADIEDNVANFWMEQEELDR